MGDICSDFYDDFNKNVETPEEKARRIGVPIIKPKRPITPIDPNGVVAVCGVCGLEMRRIMSYSCPNHNCPTGLGGASFTIDQK